MSLNTLSVPSATLWRRTGRLDACRNHVLDHGLEQIVPCLVDFLIVVSKLVHCGKKALVELFKLELSDPLAFMLVQKLVQRRWLVSLPEIKHSGHGHHEVVVLFFSIDALELFHRL